MIRSIVVSSVLLIAIAGCQASDGDEAPPAGGDVPAAAALSPGDTLTAEGIGPLRVGVYAASVWGGPRTPPSVDATCEVIEFANGPPGVKAMVNSGMVAQIILEAPSTVKTDRGFGPGDDGAAVKAAYGASAIVAPAMSAPPPAEEITVWTDGEVNDGFRNDLALRGLRYSIGPDGKVLRVRAGGPAMQLDSCG